MTFYHEGQLRYYSFDIFNECNIDQGIFTRIGGVSPDPWASLNTGGMSGDSRENVVENRRRIFHTFDRKVESIFDVWQIHSADVVVTNQPRPLEQAHQKADAIITDTRGITLFMRFGDCVPVLIVDPVRQVIGIAHAGWQGTVGKIVQKTIEAMQTQFNCRPGDILAGIGPSISVQNYEVGKNVVEKAQACFPVNVDQVIIQQDGKEYFDLWRANQVLLIEAGLEPEHIQISGICTAQNTRDWYSHRAEQGKTGRFGALLGLK